MFPPNDDEIVDPALPRPIGIRVDDKTLEEIDKELDLAGLPKAVRDQYIAHERQRRAQHRDEEPP